ncbi:hypothetical protein [Acinetobacter baumannii]|uniref:hypothetical protein n=1 Tax=Acinetobacter baumannii TaxID=470 RepID=UPI001AEC7F47|nr:hypothetical protein [Acinetobacter baumannii]MBP2966676.1 hypothetical protein [Acinetobacter baumannii]
MNCYAWELEAILEGLELKTLDEREQLAVFGFNLRYILNAKKPKLNKVINKKKQESKIKELFSRTTKKEKTSKTQNVIDALNYFKNRG